MSLQLHYVVLCRCKAPAAITELNRKIRDLLVSDRFVYKETSDNQIVPRFFVSNPIGFFAMAKRRFSA